MPKVNLSESLLLSLTPLTQKTCTDESPLLLKTCLKYSVHVLSVGGLDLHLSQLRNAVLTLTSK